MTTIIILTTAKHPITVILSLIHTHVDIMCITTLCCAIGGNVKYVIMIITHSGSYNRAKLTDCSLSVSSRRRFLHLAAASLFLSLRTRLFSSSSGDS